MLLKGLETHGSHDITNVWPSGHLMDPIKLSGKSIKSQLPLVDKKEHQTPLLIGRPHTAQRSSDQSDRATLVRHMPPN